MKLVWTILAVTFIPLVIGTAVFTDAFSNAFLLEILFMFSGLLLGTGAATLVTLPQRFGKPVAAGILLVYGILVASLTYLLWSLGQQISPPEWLVGVVRNPPSLPLPEHLVYGAMGGFLGPAIGKFLHHPRVERSPKREAQFALLTMCAGLTLALLTNIVSGI